MPRLTYHQGAGGDRRKTVGNLGPTELLIIAGVIILLFGARKLPEMARSLGKSAKAFKEETKGLRDKDGDKDKAADSGPAAQPAPPQQLTEAQPQAQTNGAQQAAEAQPAEQAAPDKVEQQNKNAS